MKLDLGSFESIRAFVKDFQQRFDRLDLLINNAGIGCMLLCNELYCTYSNLVYDVEGMDFCVENELKYFCF